MKHPSVRPTIALLFPVIHPPTQIRKCILLHYFMHTHWLEEHMAILTIEYEDCYLVYC